MLFGGSSPFIVTWLSQTTGSAVAPAYYVLFSSLAGLLAICFMREAAPTVLERRSRRDAMHASRI
jgi:hypothetical protein